MTTFKIDIYLIFVLAIAVLETLVIIEGRQIKSMKKQQVYHSKVDQQLPSRNGDPLQALTANDVPRVIRMLVAEEKSTFPSQVAGRSQGDRRLKPESVVTDSRPTSPGSSPGVGHSFTEHRFDTQSGSSPATGPGHSPGGGHSKQDQVTKPNA
ncbi:hypothetical protein SSX86_014399 [Deinandra increscens subsp. villosa]|uniref:Uncharacterized protein n=1 Tax=Deinandra increscens subsp. villosa TaxID=3103831 RepID=A0AAP0D1V5_9ASTR